MSLAFTRFPFPSKTEISFSRPPSPQKLMSLVCLRLPYPKKRMRLVFPRFPSPQKQMSLVFLGLPFPPKLKENLHRDPYSARLVVTFARKLT